MFDFIGCVCVWIACPWLVQGKRGELDWGWHGPPQICSLATIPTSPLHSTFVQQQEQINTWQHTYSGQPVCACEGAREGRKRSLCFFYTCLWILVSQMCLCVWEMERVQMFGVCVCLVVVSGSTLLVLSPAAQGSHRPSGGLSATPDGSVILSRH